MTTAKHKNDNSVESMIRATGARVTYARVQVLSVLLAAKLPLSHSDIETELANCAAIKIDRVTLYRVLDWLVEAGLAHKAANTRGLLAFSLIQPDNEHEQHMHFRCNDCDDVICLDIPKPQVPALPRGFKIAHIDLEISGKCPACSRSH